MSKELTDKSKVSCRQVPYMRFRLEISIGNFKISEWNEGRAMIRFKKLS